MRLYGYWRSSAAYRVRIALNLKKLRYDYFAVNLIKDGGQQHTDEFHRINPNELVPVLMDGATRISQSLTIIDYLDDHYPEPLLTPLSGEKRYKIKELAQDIAIDIHPLNNLRVQQYLINHADFDKEDEVEWLRHWITVGFAALDDKLRHTAGVYSVGAEVSLVDVCLVPQVYNALRFDVDVSQYPTIDRLYRALNEIPEFYRAAPERQPDSPQNKAT
ncbi:maleylacetoacetate isomerase [Vibrio panuliri]|uniref:Maleylacetoacetate isomerase n=1 Tax=Vibrio panuliri TaxID=1381081 RepID=A0A1Q9HIK3_9VIBR|nr:maleylacetoacetate isomerase [Vibrio panuliri]KAB1454312.1 maleylacetoacetate isomerase [Vibrio panuliri]OLQ89282.1 maleylacetoacetate isomerase [Vibrio panuliri]OLQ90158.1 maleylacetoacetate isomerase [Vibrio panuliri]